MPRRPRRSARVVGLLVEAFEENNLLTYASAIAFQLLIALVALVLLGLSLLHFLGVEEVWTEHLRRFVHARFSFETFLAIDTTVRRIFSEQSLPLLGFATVLATWEISGAVRAVMGALNEIYGNEETRPTWRRFAVSLVLAFAVGAALVGAVLAVLLRSAWPEAVPSPVVFVLSWGLAVALLLLAVALLLRFAPAHDHPIRWASIGSLLVIVAWTTMSVGFRFYVTHIADYRSALGNLVAVLTLTSYLYASAIVFLAGAQIDELLRRGVHGDAHIATLLPASWRERLGIARRATSR